MCLGRDERRGLRRQPGTLELELVAQPQRRPGEAAAGTSGGQIALQQDQFGVAAPPIAAAAPEPVTCAHREAARGLHLPRDQRAAGPFELGLTEILGEPVLAEDLRGRGQRTVGCLDEPGLAEHPGAVEQPHAARDLDGEFARRVHGPDRVGQPAGEELGVAEVVQRGERLGRLVLLPAYSMARTNRRRAEPSSPRSMRRLPPLIRMAESFARLGMFEQLLGGVQLALRLVEHVRCGPR